jgi:hypothetical protein
VQYDVQTTARSTIINAGEIQVEESFLPILEQMVKVHHVDDG